VVAPKEMVSQLSSTLSAQCLALYKQDGQFSYQHAAIRALGTKASFAAAGSPKNQACAWAASGTLFDITNDSLLNFGGGGVPWAQVDALAVAKCEAANKTGDRCIIILHNNSFYYSPRGDERAGGFK